MIEIKVCGVTRLDQALLMESMGVRYLGFNFIKSSPRYIAPQKASEIISELGTDTKAVGVFMNHAASHVADIAEEVGLDLLQFHGAEPKYLLKSQKLPTIKVFSITDEFNPDIIEQYEEVADYYLFDSKVDNLSGGTGKAFDWSFLEQIKSKKPYFLAGGIGPGNIVDALEATSPIAVDLNSKIERKPGLKDMALLEQCFIKAGLKAK